MLSQSILESPLTSSGQAHRGSSELRSTCDRLLTPPVGAIAEQTDSGVDIGSSSWRKLFLISLSIKERVLMGKPDASKRISFYVGVQSRTRGWFTDENLAPPFGQGHLRLRPLIAALLAAVSEGTPYACAEVVPI